MPTLMGLYMFKGEGGREQMEGEKEKECEFGWAGDEPGGARRVDEYYQNTMYTILKVLIIILLKISRK